MELTDYITDHHKKHIIFDFDDTICKMAKGGMPAYEGMCAIIAKIDPTLRDNYEHSPRSIYQLTNQAIILYGDEIQNELLQFFNTFESKLQDSEKRNDPIIEFIRQYADVYTFSIWSSNTLALIRHTLDKYQLTEKFSHIIGRDSVRLAKPYPDGFQQIVATGKYHKEDFLMVGDSESDSQAALNAGIDFYKIEQDAVDRQ